MEKFFDSFNITFIPRNINQQFDPLALEDITFNPPKKPQLKYEVELCHRPYVPDNIKHWKFFEDDAQIKWFLELVE